MLAHCSFHNREVEAGASGVGDQLEEHGEEEPVGEGMQIAEVIYRKKGVSLCSPGCPGWTHTPI